MNWLHFFIGFLIVTTVVFLGLSIKYYFYYKKTWNSLVDVNDRLSALIFKYRQAENPEFLRKVQDGLISHKTGYCSACPYYKGKLTELDVNKVCITELLSDSHTIIQSQTLRIDELRNEVSSIKSDS